MIRNADALCERIRGLHASIRDTVVAACERATLEEMAAPLGMHAGDTIFAIDRISESVLLEQFGALADEWSCVLVAEGLGDTGEVTLPAGTRAADAELRIIVDPIDGTRGLMYQKRPAWILTGVAPNLGTATGLDAIELAVMTEIPLVKQHLCDVLWAQRGQGVRGQRYNRLSGVTTPLQPQPSKAAGIAQGFGELARFFPGARDVLAAVDEDVIATVLGPPAPGVPASFEDQYLCTGGQLYELIMGHDRWVADLRPLIAPVLRLRGLPPSLCCHAYDLCTELIAREAGVIVGDATGEPLTSPLDVDSNIAWTGYANAAIAALVRPALGAALTRHGLL